MYILPLLLVAFVVNTFAGELRCLRPGAVVLSLYKDSRYFPGRVESLGESIDVTFDNGKQQSYSPYGNDVIVDDVPEVSELTGGARVLARRPNSVSFEPGFVNGSIEGLNDTFLVNYDTGDNIARPIDEVRLATKPENCMNEKGIYIGCFENTQNNYLTSYYPVNPTDVATCNWACYSRGFNFAGLQNGTWCFCGNHVNDSMKVDDNDCNIACQDSRGDVCGGYKRMTVYWTGAETSDDMKGDGQTTIDETESSNDINKELELSSIKAEPSSENAKSEEQSNTADCYDMYDSTQCNTWADAERCIQEPDWMIANCRKSCYACSYNNDDSTTGKYSPTAQPTLAPSLYQPQSPTQSMTYQPSTQYQSPGGYQNYQSDQQTYGDTSYPAFHESTTVKKSEHPVASTASAGYLGCFTDSPNDHDLEYLADIRPLSIRACITKCKSMRFPYAGVQSSTSCYCGLHYGKYRQVAHEDCNSPCESDSSEMCGGLFKNSLYKTGFSSHIGSTENAIVRKTVLPSLTAHDDVKPQSPSQPEGANYQSPQTSYQQPSSTTYNTQLYYQPASPSHSTYNQATYPEANNRPVSPASTLKTQAPNAQSVSPWVSKPGESSSYGWRDSYVKLRAQEQAKSAQISRNYRLREKFRKSPTRVAASNYLAKLKSRNFRKMHQTSRKNPNLVKPRKMIHSSMVYNRRNRHHNRHFHNELKTHRSHRKISGKGHRMFHFTSKEHLEQHKNSQKPIVLLGRKMAKVSLHRKNFGKPGIFLRKRASKKNSFLAFLPHEVTKDEGLLENVYNMLSRMLTNLRKRRKVSKNSRPMKILNKYLKLPRTNTEHAKTVPKKHVLKQNTKARPKISRKIRKKTRHRKFHELSYRPLKLSKGARYSPKGQKQLSNHYENKQFSNSQSWRDKPHTSRGQAGHELSNHSFSMAGNPSYVYRVIVRPESTSSEQAVSSSLPNNSKIGVRVLDRTQNMSHFKTLKKNIFKNSKYSSGKPIPSRQNPTGTTAKLVQSNRKQSEPHQNPPHRNHSVVHRNKSGFRGPANGNHLDSHPNKPVAHRNQSLLDRNVSEIHREKSGEAGKPEKPHKNANSHYSNDSRNITLKNEGKVNINVHERKNGRNKSSGVHEHWKEPKGHVGTLKKTKKNKNVLSIEAPLAKHIKTNGTNEIMVEKSDEDIISTIVELLEAEKRKRFHNKRKKIKEFGQLSEKKLVKRPSQENLRNRRQSRKVNVTGLSGNENENLMQEEEDYKEHEKGS